MKPVRASDIPPITAAQFLEWRLGLDWTKDRASRWLRVPTLTYKNWELGHRSPDNPGPVKKLMDKAPKPKQPKETYPQLPLAPPEIDN